MSARVASPFGLALCAALFPIVMYTDLRMPQPADALTRDIDAVLTAVYKPDGPGAAIIVTKNGRVLFRKAYGLASVELGVPMRPEMVFPVASITKQFTAAAILMLAEQGRLSLDDPITKFLPAYPAHGAPITIEHLLTHTSGLSSLTDVADLRAASSQDTQVADLITDWVKDLPADSAPGERFAYLNWGYTLLGAVIEQASGQPYAEFLDQRIFGPLGMSRTAYNDRARIVPLRVTGYTVSDGRTFNVLPDRGRIVHPRAAGGLVSTIDDLARWNAALDEGRVLSATSRDRMFTAYRLTSGASTRYGYAWDIGDYEGHPVQEHTAGTSGFLDHVLRMPQDGVYIALLTNRASLDAPAQATAHRIAALAIGKPLAVPMPVSVADGALDAFVGTYRTGGGMTYNVTRPATGIVVEVPGFPPMDLVAVAPLEFRTASVTWGFAFERDAAARVARLRVRDWTLDDVADRVAEVPATPRPIVALEPSALEACVGEYEQLTGIITAVTRSGGHLVARPIGAPPVEIFPVSPAEFVGPDGRLYGTFLKDAAGKVRGLSLRQGTRDLPARRLGWRPAA
jgi:CubicO group peptidase (beta-lactamase class C family)